MTVDRPNDVVVLLFSGRGDEEDGRRFLVTSAQEYIPSDPDLVDFSDIGRRLRDPLGHRFDLSEVASIFHDHWLLSIYDTQFARPVLSRRRDVILEKQLYSAYPLTSANAAQTQRESSVVPANLLTQRQVHLWVDGRITQAMTTRQTCGPGVEVAAVASPLAAGILRALDRFKGGTYREFMQTLQADDCARSDRLPGSLVMQGDVDLPMFASGDGARFVQYFKSGQARRAAALRAASLVADDMLARYTEPEMVLTGLALDLANAHFSNGSPHLPGLPIKDWQAQAKSRLLQVTQLEQSLKPIFWETRSRISAEAGELEQAREILRNAPPSILSQRHLAELLVEFAERSLRAQPLEILAKVDDKLKDPGSMRFDEFRIASRRLQTLIRAEQARLSEGYSIQE
ncbi:hypothetical protein [Primorskyibacter sp. 2E233]|uniref:hypothetical protein n=1 Tax=Primorskyibacter sp. 2E233 TaxID=3413431 RepID=UPI003BEF9F1E